jgi:hypothetical protein
LKKSDIDRLARLITEDPDVYLEENEDFLTVTYSNIYGETRNLTIKEAWHGPTKRWQHTALPAAYFIVRWANDNKAGSLARAGLTEESVRKIEAIAKPHKDHAEAVRLKKNAKRRARRWRSKIGIWNYMWQVYGRDCPNWWKEGHVAEGHGCWRSEFPEVRYTIDQDPEHHQLTDQEGRRFRGDHRGARGPRSTTGQPWGVEPHNFKPMYMTDYGKLSVGRDVETNEITFKLAGEDTVGFHDPEEAAEYLRTEMGVEP